MGSVYRQSGRRNWMLKYYRDGRPIVESSGTTEKTEARNVLRQREGDIARGVPLSPKVNKIRFEEAAADALTEYRINARRTLGVLEQRIRLHLAPFFERRRLSTITTSDVRRYVRQRQDEEASNGSINRELTALKRMFTLSVQAGKLLHRPHIPMLIEDNVRTGFFEPNELNRLLPCLPEAVRPVVRFAYVTGWRIAAEVLPLEWRQVDFGANEVRLDPGATKNRDGRVFKLTDELQALLKARRRGREQLQASGAIVPWVFYRLVSRGRGGPKMPRPIRSFTKAWNTACVQADLRGRIPHDLRRTAVRNMVRAGVPERVAMQLTGHKTRSVFERYNIVSDGDLDTAAAKLSAAVAKNG